MEFVREWSIPEINFFTLIGTKLEHFEYQSVSVHNQVLSRDVSSEISYTKRFFESAIFKTQLEHLHHLTLENFGQYVISLDVIYQSAPNITTLEFLDFCISCVEPSFPKLTNLTITKCIINHIVGLKDSPLEVLKMDNCAVGLDLTKLEILLLKPTLRIVNLNVVPIFPSIILKMFRYCTNMIDVKIDAGPSIWNDVELEAVDWTRVRFPVHRHLSSLTLNLYPHLTVDGKKLQL